MQEADIRALLNGPLGLTPLAMLTDETGATMLEDSTTYQLTISRGRIREAQEIVLMQGTEKFGDLPELVESAIRAIHDRERLERMARRMVKADSWDDILAVK